MKRPVSFFLVGAVSLIISAGSFLSARLSLAQTSVTPAVTNISVSTTPTSALITFKVSPAAQARIIYGKDTKYSKQEPANFDQAATNHSIWLGQSEVLEAARTYHYKIEVKLDNKITATADRTFTTPAGSSETSPLILTTRGYECANDHCQINFSTSRPASTELRWDTAAKTDYADYANVEPATTLNAIVVNGLTAGVTYHYVLKATTSTSVSMTTDLTFTTGDRTFNTGSCTVPGNPPVEVPVGSCGPSGYSCENNGVTRQSCTGACGYTCPSGTTCRADGNCENNVQLNGSPFQCNKTSCYDGEGQILNPVPPGCYVSWPSCNANTILKVKKDRGCNLWLSCATSLQTTASKTAASENLCLSLSACNSLNQQGRCNNYLPNGQCNNDPLRFCNTDVDCEAGGTCNNPPGDEPTKSLQDLTFATPGDVSKIANLSGNVIAGLDWTELGGTKVIQGQLPWQLMRQIGGVSQIRNGDLERDPPGHDGWVPVPAGQTPEESLSTVFEDVQTGNNHVLEVDPISTVDVQLCSNDQSIDCSDSAAKCTDPALCQTSTVKVNSSGAGTEVGKFVAVATEYYNAELRLRAQDGNPVVRAQFTSTIADKTVVNPNYQDITLTAAWQRVLIEPFTGLFGNIQFSVVCIDATGCSKFQIDDVQIKPVLQQSTNPIYTTPSCRLYPKADSPSCDYADKNGIVYRGWHGYCLENDSVTGGCLSWWPVDIIKGESSVFSSDTPAGYLDRAPLYICVEAAGNNPGFVGETQGPYVAGKITYRYYDKVDHGCPNGVGDWTIGQCCTNCLPPPALGTSRPVIGAVDGPESQLREDDISKITWRPWLPAAAKRNHTLEIVNTQEFHDSTRTNPVLPEHTPDNGEYNINDATNLPHQYRIFREVKPDGIRWWWLTTACEQPGGANENCASAAVVFSNVTGRAIRYELYVDDQTGESSSAQLYNVYFYTREICNKIAQVVDSGGNAQVYAQRISSNVQRVYDLNYTKSADLTPFGGLVPPQVPLDKWPLLSVEQPNYTAFTAGQSRAGTPYACNGTCTQFVCSADFTACDPNSASSISTCQQKTSPNATEPDGQCVGVEHNSNASPVASAKGPQLFSPHDPTKVDSVLDKAYFALERLRRLFVRSYGIWEWKNGSYQLMPGAGWEPPTILCPKTIPAGQCTVQQLSCPNSTPVKSTGTSRELALTEAADTCKTKVACDGADTSANACAGGTSVKYTGTMNINCTLVNPNSWVCNGLCSAKGASYSRASKTVPQTTPLYTRPDFPNDYCAIPPKIINAKFLNNTKEVTVSGGNGNVAISFNSVADAEQVPLQDFSINWGDSVDNFSYPYAPRNDSSKPHIISHVYVLNRGDNTHCTSTNNRTVCTFPIRIQVKDNWGWCNDPVQVPGCQGDPTKWYDTGLKVNVEP